MPDNNAPAVVDPKTGEALSMHDLNARIVRILNELEASSDTLGRMVDELAAVTLDHDARYYAVIATSDARSVDRRQAEAYAHVAATRLPNGESLAGAKQRLEIQVKAMKDAQHNLRSMLSGYQTLASNVRTDYYTPRN